MAIPVYINQEKASELRFSRDGLYTVLELEISGITDRLVRLWAHGNGKSAYLGVMQPWSGGMYLRRRLSRRELAAFPDPLEFVSDQAEETDETEESKHNKVDITNNNAQEEQDKTHEQKDDAIKAANNENLHKNIDITKYQEEGDEQNSPERDKEKTEERTKDLHNINSALIEAALPRQTQTDTRACPWPAEPPEEGLLWYRREDGSLTAFDGISSLLAIPAELRTKTPKMAERVIEGKKYLVFRT